MSGSSIKGLDRDRNSPLVVFAIVLAVILLAAAGTDRSGVAKSGSWAPITGSATVAHGSH